MKRRNKPSAFAKGAAALAALAELKHRWHGTASRFTLTSGKGWLALCRDDREVFRLDAAHFHGRPRLWQQVNGNTVAFGLDEARFPGTELGADLWCELWEGTFGMHVCFVYRQLGITFRGYAHDWLSAEGLFAHLNSPQLLLRDPDKGISLSINSCDANLSPTGLRFQGAFCAVLHFLGNDLGCQSMSMEIGKSSRSLLQKPAARRTIISLERGNGHWPIEPPSGKWRYSPSDESLFDSLYLEAHESRSHSRRYVAVATRSPTRTPFPIVLDQPLTGTDGQPAQFFVQRPEYAVTFGRQIDRLITADLAGTARLRLSRLLLVMRNPKGKSALSAQSRGDGPADGCVVVDAQITGSLGEAIIVPKSNSEPWNVRVDDAQMPDSKQQADATLRMAGKDPVLSGSLQFHILRPADFLDLTFRLRNVDLYSTSIPDNQELRPGPDPSQASLMIAYLPSQTLAELVVTESDPVPTDVCDDLPVLEPDTLSPGHSTLSPPSRVSLQLFTDPYTPLPLVLETFLCWDRYPLHIADTAVKLPSCGSGGVACAGLTDAVTALEMPAGIVFSPDENGVFRSSDVPRADKNTYQIWTARLASLDPTTDPSVRPICQRQLDLDQYAFTNKNRKVIVEKLARASAPLKHLAVSIAGGWFSGAAAWVVKQDDDTDMQSFRADIACGLEMLEEATYKAYLLPAGHRVSVVATTHRQWCRDVTTNLLSANLIQRYKIRYDEKNHDYNQYLVAGTGFVFPFTTIKLVGKETLYLDPGSAANFVKSCENNKFYEYWADVDLIPGHPTRYEFPVIATDRSGAEHQTTMPMLVACGDQAWDNSPGGYLQKLFDAYNSNRDKATANFGGSRVSFATPRKTGDTAYPTLAMTFSPKMGDDVDGAKQALKVPWYPLMDSATLDLDQTARFSNTPPHAPAFCYSDLYKSDSFDTWDAQNGTWLNSLETTTNKGEVLLELVPGNSLPLEFAGKMAGGLAMPSTQVQAVSRRLGTVFSKASATATNAAANLTNIANGIFDIGEAFDETATLLGAVPIADVFGGISDALAHAAAIPKLAAQQILQAEQDVVGEVTSALAPLQTLKQSIDQAVATANTWINSARSNLLNAIKPNIAFLRLCVLEQRPEDFKTLIANPLTGISADQLTQLQGKVNQSLQCRIQQANPLFGVQNQACLPTIPQLRDYLFNAALANSIPITTPYLQVINDYFAEDYPPAWQPTQAYILNQRVTDSNGNIEVVTKAGASGGTQPVWNTASATTTVDGTVIWTNHGDLNTSLDAVIHGIDLLVTRLTGSAIFVLDQQLSSLLDALSQDDLPQVLTLIGSVAESVDDAIQADIPSLVKDAIDDFESKIAGHITGCKDQLTDRINDFVTKVQGVTDSALSSTVKDIKQAIQTYLDLADSTSVVGQAINAVTDALNSVNSLAGDLKTLQDALQTDLAAANQAIATAKSFLKLPHQIRVTYDWETPLKTSSVFIASQGGQQSKLELHSQFLANLDQAPGQPQSQLTISTTVTNFSLLLLPSAPFLQVGFNSAKFTSTNESTPKVSCDLDGKSVQFLGPLDFVKDLAEQIQLPAGLVIQQLGLGVVIAYNIPVPSIKSGAFMLTGLTFYSGVHLDFTGAPLRLIFGFSSPNQHFIMAYTIFGGGGFLDMELAPTSNGVSMSLSGALEFGAVAALDFGVASGEAHVFGGFYLSMYPDDVVLSGYNRAGGELEVLGLISVCVEFLMSLTYEDRGGQAWLSGECDLTVEVDVLFFSTSVDLRLHHDFSGNSAD
jgi:hypothetical protein